MYGSCRAKDIGGENRNKISIDNNSKTVCKKID